MRVRRLRAAVRVQSMLLAQVVRAPPRLIGPGVDPCRLHALPLRALDLTAENLPPGTRLRVGEAQVEVTPEPHNGCLKFKGRFGQDALRFVQDPATRPENRRGIYWRVVEPGDVSVGAAIEVISRP